MNTRGKKQCETVTERRSEFEQLETPSEMTPLRRHIILVSPKVVVVKINAKHSSGSSIWPIHIHVKLFNVNVHRVNLATTTTLTSKINDSLSHTVVT